MLVEDSFQMIDDSARAGVSQCSYNRLLAVEVGNYQIFSTIPME